MAESNEVVLDEWMGQKGRVIAEDVEEGEECPWFHTGDVGVAMEAEVHTTALAAMHMEVVILLIIPVVIGTIVAMILGEAHRHEGGEVEAAGDAVVTWLSFEGHPWSNPIQESQMRR